ncbi:MAG: PRC-barrel domain-containing protein [Desulfotomaculaceae bacterium]|nr:PRC-barrel domain-containing protein [Desulfotomaculaceae bacterium]
MRKGKRFVSMPVISLEEGRQIGTVKEIVVDPAGKKVAALIVDQKGWFKEQRFIPYNRIHSIGKDAVTIEKTTGVEKAAGLPDIVGLLKERVRIAGAKIVSENGKTLGYVDEFYVDTATGTIAGLEFSGNFFNGMIRGRAFIDIAYVRTLGKEVVVITNEGVENTFKLEGGIQERVKTIKESTGHLWENTVQKTKDLGTSINKSMEKAKREAKTGTGEKEESTRAKISKEENENPENGASVETHMENQATDPDLDTPSDKSGAPVGNGMETGKNATPPA